MEFLMKRPAVFFDRDNTLIVSDGYLGDASRVVLVDGAPDAVARARQYGFRAVTFSNQSGVARGLFDEEAVAAVNQRMDELLQQANPNAIIDRHEFCPFHPEAAVEKYREDSFLRKPKPGMILAAAELLNLDLARSWVIGDAPRDIEAGKAAGCRTILLKDPSLPPSPAADTPSDIAPDFTAGSLREAIDLLAREAFRQPPARPAAPVVQESNGSAPAEAPSPITPAQTEEPMSTQPSASSPAAPADEPVRVIELKPEEMPAAPPPARPNPAGYGRLEELVEQILVELRRREPPMPEFSVSKLMAGIVQVVALAVLFLAYLHRANDPAGLQGLLLFAIALQTLTIALLIMGKQR
jgi:D-glycero-D-manno-heptose 1,7-bisphosphate phosphatase